MTKKLVLTAAVAAALIASPALAQPPAGQAPAQAGAAAQLGDLRREARRLTLLNALPTEARAEVEALMARGEALRATETELQLARLQAYVAALETGETGAEAAATAQAAVAEQAEAVEAQRSALLEDVRAFGESHPTLRRRLAEIVGGEAPGPLAQARRAGVRLGAPGPWGPGRGQGWGQERNQGWGPARGHDRGPR